MIQTILIISLILFGISIAITFTRIIIGPSFPDRVLALDVIGVNLVSAMAILALIYDATTFFDFILVLGILASIGTIVYSRFFERSVIIERRLDLCVNWRFM